MTVPSAAGEHASSIATSTRAPDTTLERAGGAAPGAWAAQRPRGDRHRRQRQRPERRRGGLHRHPPRARRASSACARSRGWSSWAVAGVRARDDGHRPGARHARRRCERAGLTLADMDLIELNEAFAAQVLAVLREWGLARRPRARQRQRLGHLARAPGRRHRRRASWPRCCASCDRRGGALRPGDDVHRRRPGAGRGVRARRSALAGRAARPRALDLAEEARQRRVGLARGLELGHVAAVELEVSRARAAPRATWRAKAIGTRRSWRPQTNSASAPSVAQARPEAVLAVGLLEVDLARRRVEGGAAARGEVAAQELVDAGRRPAVAARPGSAIARSARRPRRGAGWSSAELGAQQAQQPAPTGARAARPATARAAPSRSTRSGCAQADLERDAPAEAVADEVRALEPERVEQRDDRRARRTARRRARRSACRSRRSRAGRSRSRGSAGASAATRRQERRLGRAEAVEQRSTGVAGAGLAAARSGGLRACDVREAQPPGLGHAAGRGEEADAEVQVAADAQAPGAGTRPCRRARRRRSAPRSRSSAVSSASPSAPAGGSSRAPRRVEDQRPTRPRRRSAAAPAARPGGRRKPPGSKRPASSRRLAGAAICLSAHAAHPRSASERRAEGRCPRSTRLRAPPTHEPADERTEHDPGLGG